MKKSILVLLINCCAIVIYAQQRGSYELFLPDSAAWLTWKENQPLNFYVKASKAEARFSIEGTDGLDVSFDSLGHFQWTPSFDLVDRVEGVKEFVFIFQADWPDGNRARKRATFLIHHVNRPPVVEDLPAFYVKFAGVNSYQIPAEYVYDPDGDQLVIKAVPSQMPEGANLSATGLFTWNPSRGQFNALRSNPLNIEFIVQDQPDKAETRGRIRIAQTQQDLPPEILVVPGDSVFSIKEDETLHLRLYISDPNGDDNVKSTSFVSFDNRVPQSALKENTPLLYEFTWTPGYYFVTEDQKVLTEEIVFFSLDKSNNRAQRKVKVRVHDTENLTEKDALQYQKYRNSLISAAMLINLLDDNQKKLNQDYKRARRGKKNRSILNASLGAATGISPVALESDQSRVVSGIGGTTVLTLGTLEATEVIGKSKEAILEKIKVGIEIRNRIQSNGDEFARKFALKSARRNSDFEKDIDKLRATMNDQKLVLLEIDAYQRNQGKIDNKELKKIFLDFTAE